MTHSTVPRCGGMPLVRAACRTAGVVLAVAAWGATHAADDPYLQMLDEEVTKVEAVSSDKEGDDGVQPADTAGGAREASSREDFEALLREQHVGTYSFYRKLPERSREEMFTHYRNGASMEAVREKVIDRFLHP